MDDSFDKVEEIEYTYNENFSLPKDNALWAKPPTGRARSQPQQSIAAIANVLKRPPSVPQSGMSSNCASPSTRSVKTASNAKIFGRKRSPPAAEKLASNGSAFGAFRSRSHALRSETSTRRSLARQDSS
eukprot:CAMPEP_0185831408 /NCGR_PEP_ID=MMETSP1353-20130828/1473_1 /TAXON_ID=1077150 /ORGANISM="Erythrolobus australicus, Strain CCMP3124" /LENGTH=128 /DNA_ID=CAMNT_0028529463 /DNA_START=346 /DNA_END=732 /DNA_ORIENTATION=+